jgi:hypothetical protein
MSGQDKRAIENEPEEFAAAFDRLDTSPDELIKSSNALGIQRSWVELSRGNDSLSYGVLNQSATDRFNLW